MAMNTTGHQRQRSLVRRQRDFRLLWIGQTTSMVGTFMSGVVLPLVAIVSLGAGPLVVALIEVATWAPWLLIGLPVGALADRMRSRPVMIVCDLVGLSAVASLPVALALDVLTVAHLLVAALVVGVRSVFFEPAYYRFVPHLVAEDDLGEANAMLHGSESVALAGGPALAGLVVSLAGVAWGLLTDVASYAVSALCLWRIGTAEPAPERGDPRPDRRLTREIREGLDAVRRDPYLRAFAVAGGLQNLTLSAVGALQVFFLVDTLGTGSAATGLLIGAAGVGGLIGAAVSPRLSRALGTARTALLCVTVSSVAGLLVPLARPGLGLALYAAGVLVPTAALVAGNVVTASFVQRYCPRSLLGRVGTIMRMTAYAAAPVGALTAGLVAQAADVRPALWLYSLVALLAVVVLAASPVGRRRDLPTTYIS